MVHLVGLYYTDETDALRLINYTIYLKIVRKHLVLDT